MDYFEKLNLRTNCHPAPDAGSVQYKFSRIMRSRPGGRDDIHKEMITFKTPSGKEFQEIINYISEFELDNRELRPEQFTTAFRNDELVGFGRLRAHEDCMELCSLGVVAAQRRQGIGKAIVNELINRAPEKLYLVCVIPGFFIPFGFRIISDHPSSIKNKLQYCSRELAVPETYTAMLLQK